MLSCVECFYRNSRGTVRDLLIHHSGEVHLQHHVGEHVAARLNWRSHGRGARGRRYTV